MKSETKIKRRNEMLLVHCHLTSVCRYSGKRKHLAPYLTLVKVKYTHVQALRLCTGCTGGVEV
jgi:hypothetical protein